MTILVVIMKSCVPGMYPQMVKTRYWAEDTNKTNINKDNLEHICMKYKAKYKSKVNAESFGQNYQQRSNIINWKTGRGISDHRISKNPVLTKQEYYSAKDKRLNQKVVLTSHLLDNRRKVMYCWNHKVASSFWMWMFTKIDRGEDPPAGKPTYNIQYRMSPKSLSSCHKHPTITSY